MARSATARRRRWVPVAVLLLLAYLYTVIGYGFYGMYVQLTQCANNFCPIPQVLGPKSRWSFCTASLRTVWDCNGVLVHQCPCTWMLWNMLYSKEAAITYHGAHSGCCSPFAYTRRARVTRVLCHCSTSLTPPMHMASHSAAGVINAADTGSRRECVIAVFVASAVSFLIITVSGYVTTCLTP